MPSLHEPRVIGLFALAEGEPAGDPPRTWIQVMIAGKFKHSSYGPFEITGPDLAAFAADIQERGDRILVDFDHASAEGRTEAAGWFTGQTRTGTDGQGREALFAQIEFTPAGATAVRERRYRFISPEFARSYRDSAGKLVKKVRLYAAALTNRPFLPDMDAVTLSDLGVREITRANLEIPAAKRQAIATALGLTDDLDLVRLAETDGPLAPDLKQRLHTMAGRLLDATQPTEGDPTMDPKILTLLGLPENADTAAVETAVTALTEKASKTDELTKQLADKPELGDDVAKLLGDQPEEALKRLISSAQKGEAAAKQLHEMRRDTLLDQAVRDGKILPAEKDNYARFFDLDPDGTDKLVQSMQPRGILDVQGSGGDTKPDADLAKLSDRLTYTVAGREFRADDDSLKLHAKAIEILKNDGKELRHTDVEYQAAIERAATQS